jgi:hypothetical protein
MVDAHVTIIKAATKAVPTPDAGRTWIVLDDNPNIPPTGQFVSVNGNGCLIRVGEPVLVRNEILEVLDHALEAVAQTTASHQRTGNQHDRRRFSYHVVPAPK